MKDKLQDKLKWLCLAMGKDMSRPSLRYAKTMTIDGNMYLVTTDSYRLHALAVNDLFIENEHVYDLGWGEPTKKIADPDYDVKWPELVDAWVKREFDATHLVRPSTHWCGWKVFSHGGLLDRSFAKDAVSYGEPMYYVKSNIDTNSIVTARFKDRSFAMMFPINYFGINRLEQKYGEICFLLNKYLDNGSVEIPAYFLKKVDEEFLLKGIDSSDDEANRLMFVFFAGKDFITSFSEKKNEIRCVPMEFKVEDGDMLWEIVNGQLMKTDIPSSERAQDFHKYVKVQREKGKK